MKRIQKRISWARNEKDEENVFARKLTPLRTERRRSITHPRSSREISGSFNDLLHRRDAPARAAIREEQQPVADSSSRPEINDNPTRSSSPAPSNIIPPPRLPPPTLQELGPSFSVITADLSPSHFSTPPSSGAFLSPHYLLLCHAQGLDIHFLRSERWPPI
ncbi:hypothetical protein DFJ43DRAFT_1170600 [Lentinula guzmanii]|uniref:Uncharacterized protein n=2 Tax=Lentinula TaxID=5352 RepID=A0AA38J654_9AGAR|nr:hypothetical protein DFJ43DRAFT_1170600 [Lentinula guzmanii]KAJ3745415.1 hypothetical protein DFH05DRAFT_1609681 [Lentinula detonsa]KAJ3791663.1 hypothetical protein GGU11DRAFT_827411 [Lentinula aff. detonsa]KAJ3978682.1 hypothetical protein F5890DRAFT_1654709 [Lentinula detonsa]